MKQLHLLGSAKLILDDGKEVKLGSGANLLAYLVFHASGVDRKRCVHDLYPDEEYEISGNRLRVALVRFKKFLGNTIVSEGDRLRLDFDQIEVDVLLLRANLQDIHDEVDAQEEFEQLTKLGPRLSEEVLPDVSELWAVSWQESWRRECTNWLTRLYNLAVHQNDWKVASEAARWNIGHDQSANAWEMYLKAQHKLGNIESALREVTLAERLGQLSEPDSQHISKIAAQICEQNPEPSERWTRDELVDLGKMFARAITDSPDDAAAFMHCFGAEREFFRDRTRFLPFIFELSNSKLSENWEIFTRLRMIDAIYDDWRGVLRETERLLEMNLSQAQRGRVNFSRSFALFTGRDFDGALACIREAICICQEVGDELRSINCQAAEGSYIWHIGDHERAIEIYAKSIKELKKFDKGVSRSNIGVIWSNLATIHVIDRDWERAREAVKGASAMLEIEPNETIFAMFNTVAGLVEVERGNWKKGTDLLSDGLKRGYRRKSSREQQLGLEWAAGALDLVGFRSDALALLEWVDAWRIRTSHGRSVSEKRYADNIARGERAKVGSKIDPNEDSKKVIQYAVGRLREAEANNQKQAAS